MSDGGVFSVWILIIVWIAFSVIVGVIAGQRGREGINYFFLALLISPLITIIILIATPIVIPPDPTKTKCPHCHGLVDQDVECCMHCGRDINKDIDSQLSVSSFPNPPEESLPLKEDHEQHQTNLDNELDLKNCPHCGKMFLYDHGTQTSVCTHCLTKITLKIIEPEPVLAYEVECPDCGKSFPIKSNVGIIEELCPHCQAILKLDTMVAG